MAKVDYSEKRAKWLENNGFNTNEKTYIYFPANSYDVKEELKEAGFKFNPELLWHIAEVPEQYVNDCVEISLSQVAEMTAWGQGLYRPDVKKVVNDMVKAARPAEPESHWIGEEKEKVVDYPVILKSIRPMETKFGFTQLVKFFDEEGNEINWWTAVDIQAEVGSEVLLSGTIKKLDTYNERKITVMTRCKIKEM